MAESPADYVCVSCGQPICRLVAHSSSRWVHVRSDDSHEVVPGLSPTLMDKVDTRLLALAISSLTLDLSLPDDDGPRWGRLNERAARTIAQFVKDMDRLTKQHIDSTSSDT